MRRHLVHRPLAAQGAFVGAIGQWFHEIGEVTPGPRRQCPSIRHQAMFAVRCLGYNQPMGDLAPPVTESSTVSDRRDQALRYLREDRIMAVLRQIPAEHLVPLADRLIEAGVRSLEITHDYDRATDDVALLVARFGDDASIGVGTTWSIEQAESAAAAGATFCVLPGVDAATALRSAELGMLTLPGVQTPAEIQLAIRSGADVLKFFPADPPGAAWLAQVVPAYAQRPFMATGGVTVDNMSDFFAAGAIAVGMGDSLFGRYDDPDEQLIRAAVAVARS